MKTANSPFEEMSLELVGDIETDSEGLYIGKTLALLYFALDAINSGLTELEDIKEYIREAYRKVK